MNEPSAAALGEAVASRTMLDSCRVLQSALGTAEGDINSLLARVAVAYHSDPWDAIRDSQPGGLEDDIVVLATAVIRCGLERPDGRVRAALDLAASYTGRRPWLGKAIELGLTPPADGGRLEELRASTVSRLSQAFADRVDRLGLDGDLSASWLAVAPASAEPATGPTVGLYGRTSSGKTTLMRRLLGRLAPGFENLAKYLQTDSGAHTTRIPFVFDFRPDAAGFYWSAAAPGTNVGGALQPGELGNECGFEDNFVDGRGPAVGWVIFVLPSEFGRPLRLIDMPGTHGFRTGPWGRVAHTMREGLDALVLPMDRRYFRREEQTDLRSALGLSPPRSIAISLRWVDPAVAPLTPDRFLGERVVEGMEADSPGSDRLQALSVFEIAPTSDRDDGLDGLVSWLLNRPRVARHSASYHGLEKQAQAGEPLALEALAYLGLLRAWTAIDATDEDD